MRFQVLFCEDDDDVIHVDGILYDRSGTGLPVTINADVSGSVSLATVIRARLHAWADDVALVDLQEAGKRLVMGDGRSRVRL